MEEGMYQRIMVPLDGSEHAESVISLACRLASTSDAEITLLCVVEYPSDLYSGSVYCMFYPNPTGDPGVDEKIWQKKEAVHSKVKSYLEGLASRIDTSAHKVSIEIQEGPVVHAILSSIENLEIDLVIMSTTGEGCNPWMMGAVADRIIREAQVPVILMRTEPCNLVPDLTDQRSHSKKIKRARNYDYSR
jgi:nucleotide-binding universal stress UspA family protein